MLGRMKDIMQQLQTAQRLMKDDNFKALVSHPKVQEVFRDPEFVAVMQSKDPAKIVGHPKLAALMRDPEIAALFGTVDFRSLFQG